MPAPAPPPNVRRILVVEDEYLIAVEMKRWLQAAGFDVVGPVPSMTQALDLIENHELDAAVLDVNLGNGETAHPVADRLRTLGVPYLFATGDVRATGAAAEQHGPRLEKQFIPRDLVQALVVVVDKQPERDQGERGGHEEHAAAQPASVEPIAWPPLENGTCTMSSCSESRNSSPSR